MRINWISRLARAFAELFESPFPEGYVGGGADRDAERVRSELDAIRVHFPDHA